MKLKHPYIKDIEVEVSDDVAAEWQDAGWLTESQRRKPELKTALDEASSPVTAEGNTNPKKEA